ncbi:MAG: peptidoglycan-binding protein [Bacillota bacterium]|nr:peptidoglycan-binding protein [Bacillota bacterium]
MAYVNFGSRVLRLNSSGTDVEILQYLLNHLPIIGAPSLVTDGFFGPNTEEAVRKFQEYFGLAVDGVVGKNTFLYFGQQTSVYLPSGAPVFGSRTLKKGMSSRDVWVLQNRLASTAMKYAMALGGSADSIFGSKTQAAVKLFQKDRGLVQDGIVGPKTYFALFLYTYMGGRYLQRTRADRNQGYDVYFLQKNLKAKGFYDGILDGKFGIVTQTAVKDLQKSVAIAVDGVVGPKTYFHLAPV